MKALESILKQFTVLIAEDDDVVRQRLKNTLNFYFHTVYEAYSGEEAYALFLNHKPSLVISDIEMCDGDGIELVKNIRKITLNTPIIILSAYSKEEYLLKLINLKIDQYIIKPTTNKALFEAISNALCKESTTILSLNSQVSLDTLNNTLIYNNETIILRKKEKDFLELLYQNKHKITKYDLIEEYIWNDKSMSQDALKTFIKELRKKLPVPIVENVIQEGYKLAEEHS